MDLTHTPPLQSNWRALDVLCEEIINNLGGTSKQPRWLSQQLVFPCLHYLLLMDRQASPVLVMAPPRVHVPPTYHALWASAAKPSLHLHSIIHEVHNPVIFLWFQVQVQECVSNQYFRLIRVIVIRIPCWILCQLPSAFSQ